MSALPIHVFNPFAVLAGSRKKESYKISSPTPKQHQHQVTPKHSPSPRKQRRTSPVTPIFHARTLRDINRVREGRRVDQIFAQNTITVR